ncbi:MAG TPA: hypothetical protein VGL86_20500 [Polyangia bacterium]|jgi:hypothetical protein
MRTLLFLALLAAAGCGDDTTQATAADLSMTVHDFAGQPTSCSSTGVAQSCAGASGQSGCFVCDLSGGAGVCARVCSLLAPNECPAGQTCHEFTGADGGMVSGIAVEGAGCAGFGYCH